MSCRQQGLASLPGHRKKSVRMKSLGVLCLLVVLATVGRGEPLAKVRNAERLMDSLDILQEDSSVDSFASPASQHSDLFEIAKRLAHKKDAIGGEARDSYGGYYPGGEMNNLDRLELYTRQFMDLAIDISYSSVFLLSNYTRFVHNANNNPQKVIQSIPHPLTYTNRLLLFATINPIPNAVPKPGLSLPIHHALERGLNFRREMQNVLDVALAERLPDHLLDRFQIRPGTGHLHDAHAALPLLGGVRRSPIRAVVLQVGETLVVEVDAVVHVGQLGHLGAELLQQIVRLLVDGDARLEPFVQLRQPFVDRFRDATGPRAGSDGQDDQGQNEDRRAAHGFRFVDVLFRGWLENSSFSSTVAGGGGESGNSTTAFSNSTPLWNSFTRFGTPLTTPDEARSNPANPASSSASSASWDALFDFAIVCE
uniref:Uncharacterized protein n=1 Tax=Anopheles farauti TaxID=69004 RepID=A0A182QZR7_9DIPT